MAGPAHADGSHDRRAGLRAVYLSQLHVREHGRNAGPEVEAYQKGGGGKKGDAWCSWFVSWCLRKAHVKTAYFGAARSWFDARHIIWQNGRGFAPQTGDVVGYQWGNSRIAHVGFIDVWGPGPSCQTVEGNTSGGRENRDGDGVFKNWRLKRQVTAVANVIDNPSY